MESKITQFGLVIVEKSKSEVERNFRKSEERKIEIKDEIKLNYNPKLQIDDTSRYIRGKTRILTRDSDLNDPINRRIQGFLLCDFKTGHRCSRDEFSLIDRWNLTFNHSVDAETSLEEIRSEKFKDGRV